MKPTLLLLASLAVTSPVLFADDSAAAQKKETAPKTTEPPKTEKVKPYKLETCIVSDEKLGSMGKPVVFEHKGQEFKLCCKACRKDFDKDPEKYVKKLAEKQK